MNRVEASGSWRSGRSFPKLTLAEKAALLETYHPDFRLAEKREIPIGPNKGGMAPKELVDLLESSSQLVPEAIDLAKVTHRTDVLVIGSGGAGVTAALTARENGGRGSVNDEIAVGRL